MRSPDSCLAVLLRLRPGTSARLPMQPHRIRRPRLSLAPAVVRLDTGEVLLSYREAARRLGATLLTLKTWLSRGWLSAAPYHHPGTNGQTRFVLLAEVERLRRHRAHATGHLFTAAAAAEYLDVPAAKLRALVRTGRLRETAIGQRLYAKEDLDRLRLRLAGITDPIRVSEAAKLPGATSKVVERWARAGKLRCVQTNARATWCSAATARRLALQRHQELQQYRADVVSRTHLTIPDAARLLGIEKASLLRGLAQKRLRRTHYKLIRRTGINRTDLEEAHALGRFRHRIDLKLPKGLLDVEEAAKLLNVTPALIRKWALKNRLPVAGRGRIMGRRARALGFRRRDLLRVRAELNHRTKRSRVRAAR